VDKARLIEQIIPDIERELKAARPTPRASPCAGCGGVLTSPKRRSLRRDGKCGATRPPAHRRATS